MIFIFEFTFYIFVLYFIISQILMPSFNDKRMFPMFRKTKNEIKEIYEKLDEKEDLKKIEELKEKIYEIEDSKEINELKEEVKNFKKKYLKENQ